MELKGFEPLTSSVRLRRAPNCATAPLTEGDFTTFKQNVKSVAEIRT